MGSPCISVCQLGVSDAGGLAAAVDVKMDIGCGLSSQMDEWNGHGVLGGTPGGVFRLGRRVVSSKKRELRGRSSSHAMFFAIGVDNRDALPEHSAEISGCDALTRAANCCCVRPSARMACRNWMSGRNCTTRPPVG